MSNALVASGDVPSVSVEAHVPTYVATSYTGASFPKTLVFSAGAPPTDGSIGLAFIALDPAMGIGWQGGGSQRLVNFRGATGNTATTDIGSVVVPGWSFV